VCFIWVLRCLLLSAFVWFYLIVSFGFLSGCFVWCLYVCLFVFYLFVLFGFYLVREGKEHGGSVFQLRDFN